jgi:hypothetical protein
MLNYSNFSHLSSWSFNLSLKIEFELSIFTLLFNFALNTRFVLINTRGIMTAVYQRSVLMISRGIMTAFCQRSLLIVFMVL